MADDLLQLKRRIEQLNREVARDEGSLTQLMETLHEQGFDSLSAATRGLEQLEQDIADIEHQLSDQVAQIRETMAAWED